ncbi:MAG: amidohydrolase family protein [Ramlibacter sp.]
MSFFRCIEGGGTVVPRAMRDRRGPLVVDMHCHMLVEDAETLVNANKPAQPEVAHRFASAETRKVSVAMVQSIKDRIRTTGTRLEDMDAAGIDVQVISPAPGHYCYWAGEELGREIARKVNDGLAAAVAKNAGRLLALGTVPMQSPRLAVEELRRCMGELGMRGVEISTHVNDDELADPRFREFFAAAQELGAVIFLHPTGFTQGQRLANYHLNNVIGNPLDTTVALAHLIYGGVLDEYPGLKICVAHGGGTIAAYPGRFDHAWRERHDCSAHCQHEPSHYLRRMFLDTIVFDPAQLRALAAQWGPQQLVLGTDYPYDMSEPDPVGFVHRSGLDAEAVAGILGGNAARLLGLEPAEWLLKARPVRG